MNNYSPNFLNKTSRELGIEDINNLTPEKLNEFYLSGNYETYFVEYIGNIIDSLNKLDYADIFITGKFFGILFVAKGMLNKVLENVPEIINIEKNYPYTLSELILNSDNTNYNLVNKGEMTLEGEGVIVGIIGTGIDYLNPRFMTPEGDTRIIDIWDQTIKTGPHPTFFPYGTEYSQNNINTAIKSKAIGRDPYEVVSHKDDIGHGTAIAGIIGGRKVNVGDPFRSVAPKCEFAIVKLEEAREDTLELAGIKKGTKKVYQSTNISSAIRYLSDLQGSLKKPMVVYLPLGSNFGGRDGDTVLERYIDTFTQRRNFSVVMNTGNQGNGETHASGIIENTGDIKDVLINVGENQQNLSISIYTHRPDRIFISVISPTGQSIRRIPIPTIKEQNKYLLFEENGINIEYFAQEKLTGDISVDMLIKNTTPGIWKIRLSGEYILSGRYDSWIPQEELLEKETKFLAPDPYITLLTPSTATNSITTSYYNQINDEAAPSSGRGFPRNGIIIPSMTIEGFNLLTVGLNESLIIASGAAMAGAILAGAVSFIYQWGLVEENNQKLYPPRVKNYLIAATEKDDEKIYPNEEWGYGKFSFNKLNEVLNKSSQKVSARKTSKGSQDDVKYLYINILVNMLK